MAGHGLPEGGLCSTCCLTNSNPGISSAIVTTNHREKTTDMDRTLDRFFTDIRAAVTDGAASKGYNATGPDGPNALYEFILHVNHGPGHAVGEAIYKLIRYSQKHNEEDLIKCAAWAFLLWKYHGRLEASHHAPVVISGTTEK